MEERQFEFDFETISAVGGDFVKLLNSIWTDAISNFRAKKKNPGSTNVINPKGDQTCTKTSEE